MVAEKLPTTMDALTRSLNTAKLEVELPVAGVDDSIVYEPVNASPEFRLPNVLVRVPAKL